MTTPAREDGREGELTKIQVEIFRDALHKVVPSHVSGAHQNIDKLCNMALRHAEAAGARRQLAEAEAREKKLRMAVEALVGLERFCYCDKPGDLKCAVCKGRVALDEYATTAALDELLRQAEERGAWWMRTWIYNNPEAGLNRCDAKAICEAAHRAKEGE